MGIGRFRRLGYSDRRHHLGDMGNATGKGGRRVQSRQRSFSGRVSRDDQKDPPLLHMSQADTFRPPPRFNILTLLSPFTLPSSAPILAIPAAALHLGAITGLVSLAGALPLYIANVPCLGTTSPRNALGGRLGTLTDLSLLRLLNALDPSLESPSRSESISAAANLASSRMSLLHSVHSGPARRALSDTIAPAISSAHVRLIIVLVLIGLITLLGGLVLVLRVFRMMESQRRKMNEEAQWVDVVVLSKEEVPGWTGGEARLRERLVAAIKGTEDQDIGTRGEDAGQGEQDAAGQGEVDVQGVFAIP